jgi:hypothetical protein
MNRYVFTFVYRSQKVDNVVCHLSKEDADKIANVIFESLSQDDKSGVIKLPEVKNTIRFIRLSQVDSVRVYKEKENIDV